MSDTKEIGLWVQYHMKQTNVPCTVKQQKNIQVQDQNKWKKKKKEIKKQLHTQVYTVEMGKCTKNK